MEKQKRDRSHQKILGCSGVMGKLTYIDGLKQALVDALNWLLLSKDVFYQLLGFLVARIPH